MDYPFAPGLRGREEVFLEEMGINRVYLEDEFQYESGGQMVYGDPLLLRYNQGILLAQGELEEGRIPEEILHTILHDSLLILDSPDGYFLRYIINWNRIQIGRILAGNTHPIISQLIPLRQGVTNENLIGERSMAMHIAANASRNQIGIAWKVGNLHIQDIERYIRENRIPSPLSYALTNQQEFNNRFVPWVHQNQEQMGAPQIYVAPNQHEVGELDLLIPNGENLWG